MGKRIWPLEKFQRMLDILLEPEAYVGRSDVRNGTAAKRTADEPKLSQLLQNERINGPSDRDQTVAARELVPFKGPYLYVYDIEEKYKPIMLREYPKVNTKYEGEWPQFRTVADGRCPFVEEPDHDRRKARAQEKEKEREKEKEKERPVKAVVESRPTLQPPEATAPKPVVGKRSLAEMQDGQNQVRTGVKPMDMFHATKPLSKQVDLSGFTSRAPAARLFHGEPVASGVQPSHLTSAIRSQMISSASGIGGIKAGTSKEILGLQRRVLQRTTNSQDPSSRRPEADMDPSSRSTSMGRVASRRLELIEDGADKASSKPQPAPQKSRRDLKSGYCENCQDKFKDFDEVCPVERPWSGATWLTFLCSTSCPASTAGLRIMMRTGPSWTACCHSWGVRPNGSRQRNGKPTSHRPSPSPPSRRATTTLGRGPSSPPDQDD